MVAQGELQTSQVTDDGPHDGKSSLQSASTHNSRQRNSVVRNDHSNGLYLPSQVHQCSAARENHVVAQGESQTPQVTDDGLHGEKSSLQSVSMHISRQRNLIDRNDHSDGLHPPSQVHQCFAAGKTHVVVQGDSQTSQVTDDGLHGGKSSFQSASTNNSRQRNSMVRNDNSDGLHLTSQVHVHQCIATRENHVVAQGELQTPQVTDDGLHGEKSSFQGASTHISKQRNSMERNDHSDALHRPSQVQHCIAVRETHANVQGESQIPQVTDGRLHVEKSFLQSASTYIIGQRNSTERNDHSNGLKDGLLELWQNNSSDCQNERNRPLNGHIDPDTTISSLKTNAKKIPFLERASLNQELWEWEKQGARPKIR